MTKEAHLVLADGTRFSGTSFGAEGATTGEAVFTTGMTGYEEVLTDPSYCGQIVTMTAPQIGNTGINLEDGEAKAPALRGFVVRELSAVHSNWRTKESLDAYLKRNGIIGITPPPTSGRRAAGFGRSHAKTLVPGTSSPWTSE